MRKIRPDARRALLRVQRAQSPRNAPSAHSRASLITHQRTQRNRLVKLNQRIAPVEQYLHQLASRTGDRPVFNQQQPDPGMLLLRRPPPVHGDGHQLYIQLRIGSKGGDHLLELWRRAAIEALVPETTRTGQIEKRAEILQPVQQPLLRPRQSELYTGVLQNCKVRDAVVLQHVTNRLIAITDMRDGLIGPDFVSHPEREKAPQQPASGPIHLLKGNSRKIERDQEVFEQVLNDANLVVQTVVTIHEVQRGPVVLSETDAVLNRDYFVLPTVDDGRRTIEDSLPQLGQSVHVQRG